MQFENSGNQLAKIIESNVGEDAKRWLAVKILKITSERSTKDLYLTYSLIASKINTGDALKMPIDDSGLKKYLEAQKANIQQLSRIYVLVRTLEADIEFFTPKVANIIQVADTGELETFLKFLVLLPNPEKYKSSAVDALRTNISTIFNAIALNNPYPALYFDEQQWNQMYLKTAFMEGDLSAINDVDDRANKELTRIISDYAHERWAASRTIDPYFWQPVSKFLDETLLGDMVRLLKSDDICENNAAGLCCYYSDNPEGEKLLEAYPKLKEDITSKKINWNNLKD